MYDCSSYYNDTCSSVYSNEFMDSVGFAWRESEAKARKYKIHKKAQSGRSMVEMLGVLAVIGVLSVAGIAGFKTAMDKHRSNELMNEASKRAVIVMAQLAQGRTGDISLAEFTNNDVSGARFATSATTVPDTNKFAITVSGVDKSICQNLVNMAGGKVQISKSDNVATPITAAQCADSDSLAFLFESEQSFVGSNGGGFNSNGNNGGSNSGGSNSGSGHMCGPIGNRAYGDYGDSYCYGGDLHQCLSAGWTWMGSCSGGSNGGGSNSGSGHMCGPMGNRAYGDWGDTYCGDSGYLYQCSNTGWILTWHLCSNGGGFNSNGNNGGSNSVGSNSVGSNSGDSHLCGSMGNRAYGDYGDSYCYGGDLYQCLGSGWTWMGSCGSNGGGSNGSW